MAFTSTYIRISTANYEALPCPQSFIDKRGPIYFPSEGDNDPILMTSDNAGIADAYETRYPNMLLSINDNGEGEAPGWGVGREVSSHQILTLPNLSQREIKDILAAADALGFDTQPVILAHDELRNYKSKGALPES